MTDKEGGGGVGWGEGRGGWSGEGDSIHLLSPGTRAAYF